MQPAPRRSHRGAPATVPPAPRNPRSGAAAAVTLAVLAVVVPGGPAVAADCVAPSTQTSVPAPWPQLALAPDRIWPLTRGQGITVAVLDSGVDARSGQLAGRVLPGIAAVPDAGPTDRDCDGHGTAAAGLVAAAPARGTGFAGIAPAARILPVLVGGSTVEPAVLAGAITRAVAAGARVVLVSAKPSRDDQVLRAAVAAAVRADALVVAGADGASGGALSYPAAYPEVLAVAGVGPAGTGSGAGGGGSPPAGQRVDLVAPGDQLVSLGVGPSGQVGAAGAPMAAAYAAGTAALLRAYRPALTAAQVRARLITTAAPAGGPVPHPRWGHGTLDPYAAITALAPRGARAEVGPVRVAMPVRPAPPDTTRRDTALLIGLATIAATALCAAAVAVTRRGRARHWHPA